MATSDSDGLEAILEEFPPVEYAIAYGSAIFAQRGYTQQQTQAAMTDLVFAVRSTSNHHVCTHPTAAASVATQVDDPYAWHRENLQRHRGHYSALALLGPAAITAVQERIGASVYFNTLVPVLGRLVKYGVVSRCPRCRTRVPRIPRPSAHRVARRTQRGAARRPAALVDAVPERPHAQAGAGTAPPAALPR